MPLEEVMQYLIGIGAAIAADCEPCLKSCLALSREYGADEQDIRKAMMIGTMVRRCAAHTADGTKDEKSSAEDGCVNSCGSPETKDREYKEGRENG